MVTRSKQVWEVGSVVRVGFLTLKVAAKVPTPGDYRPDSYALTSLDGSRFYQFTPHNGCVRCATMEEACNA